MIYIAHLQHGPEDLAIGLGRTEDEAVAALLEAYPAAKGKPIDVVETSVGKGFASLTDAPLIARLRA